MNHQLRPALFSLTVLPLLTAWAVVALLAMEGASEAAKYATVIPLVYLIGSIPWGYILLRWWRGVDIRDYGSGRTGMTNVLRTGGSKIASLVFLLDLGKGAAAVVLARLVIGPGWAEVVAGLLALAGHNWPVFLRFRGGRGILPGVGGLSVIAPLPALIGLVAFVPTVLISRYVSLGSLVGVSTACIAIVIMAVAGTYSTVYIVYVAIGGSVIIWQHRDNIQRIRNGTERRLGQAATTVAQSVTPGVSMKQGASRQ